MENNDSKQILEESKKMRKNVKIPLVIIGILIVLLLVLGVFFYFKKNNTQNIYYEIIDNFASMLSEPFNDNNNTKAFGYKADMEFILNSSDESIKNLANILNNFKINIDAESDFDNKIANMNVLVNYNNKGNLETTLYVNNDSIYADLKTLYDKPIRIINDDSIKEIWSKDGNSDFKLIIEQLRNEIKQSLKSEYFSKTNDSIKIMGSDVKVIKHSLVLEGDSLYEFNNSLIDNIKNNNKLLNALIEISNMDKNEFLENLDSSKNNEELRNYSFVSNIYVNRLTNNIERVEFTISSNEDKSNLVFNKIEDDKYDIFVDNNKIGDITIKDNTKTININYNEANIRVEYTVNNNDIDLAVNMKFEDNNIEFKLNNNNGKGTSEFNLKGDDLELTVKLNFEEKDVNNVSAMNISNYIDINDMSEADFEKLYSNVLQNSLITELMVDIF